MVGWSVPPRVWSVRWPRSHGWLGVMGVPQRQQLMVPVLTMGVQARRWAWCAGLRVMVLMVGGCSCFNGYPQGRLAGLFVVT